MLDALKELLKGLTNRQKFILALLIVFGITGGVSGGYELIKWGYEQRPHEPDMAQALHLTEDAFNEMQALRADVDADKVILLKAHDSGRPRPGSSMFSSVIYEVYGSGSSPVKAEWHEQVLDEAYIRMLGRVYDTGLVHIVTEDLKPSILKDVYKSRGVTESRVVKVHTTDKEMFYLSLTWKGPIGTDEHQLRNQIRASVNILSKIIKSGEAL